MLFLKVVFLLGIFIVWYSYIGYGCLIWAINKIKNRVRTVKKQQPVTDFPEITLVIAAYNEASIIDQKIQNSYLLDYPANKLNILIITDGSSDGTDVIAGKHERVKVLHQPERRGKIDAIHRAMQYISTPVVVFSDANTVLNSSSIKNIARHYADPKVGGVAGEKKIQVADNTKVAGAGEGLYWKYESWLKKNDSDLYTVVGAAGELFSIRTELYEYVGKEVLLDDFIISLRICRKGYRIVYEPDAFATEAPSTSMAEEQKRKIRISAGAFQSMVMLKGLLNIFKYRVLSFQYISHRVLRWTLCPLMLPLILLINIILVVNRPDWFLSIFLLLQLMFYFAAGIGWMLSREDKKIKILYVPYYFVFLNVSLYLGLVRYLKGSQTVLWDKATRENYA